MSGRLRFAVVVPTLIVMSLAAMAAPQGWLFLGERGVTDGQDHDNIMVTGSRGHFRSIKLAVRQHAVDFHKVVVNFGNGTKFEVELRHTIPAGGESRAIDLPGDQRTIRSVDFWYDAKTSGGHQAVVRLFGRR